MDNLLRLIRDPNLLPSEKQELLSRIADQSAAMNMPCYVVGGFVRDLLLGQPVNDLDVIVEGDAIKLGEALVKIHGGKLTSHHKFHTAIWHLPSSFILYAERSSLDLITARSETYAQPGALPTVKLSTIDNDLRRRDFTINAMAVRLDGGHFGELLDPLNGQDDLAKKIIRVLHPRSFLDDPTRIFRAIRYAARYSFNFQPSTFNLINQESLAVLLTLSGERIRHEFDLIFEEENFPAMLSRLDELGIFGVFEPSLPKFSDRYFALLNSAASPEFGIPHNRLMLSYLFWFMDSPLDVIRYFSKRLDFTSELTEASLALAQLKTELPLLKDSKPSKWTMYLEKFPLFSVYVLWLVSSEPALKEFLVNWRHVKQKTTGDDLKALGIPPGPRYKEILTRLRAAQLDGEVKNEKEEKELLKTLL